MAASQVTPSAAPVAPAAGFTATTTTTTTTATTAADQDWNMAGPPTTSDWAAEDTGDWGSAEPKVSHVSPSEKCMMLTLCLSYIRPLQEIGRVKIMIIMIESDVTEYLHDVVL